MPTDAPILDEPALRGLPSMSVVLDDEDNAWQKRGNTWYQAGGDPPATSQYLAVFRPVRLSR